MKITLKRNYIFYYLFMIVFLPPEGLIELQMFEGVSYLLAGCRYIISIFTIMHFFTKRTNINWVHTAFFYSYSLTFISQIIALYMSANIYLTAALSCVTFIGFMLCNIMLFQKDRKSTLLCYRNYLFVCIIIHAITIFLFPNGFNNSATQDGRIFFMGGKNTITTYVIFAFLVSYLYINANSKGKCWKTAIFLSVISILNRSSTLIIVMIILDGYLVMIYLIGRYNRIKSLIQRMYAIILIAVLLYFIFFIVLSGDSVSPVISLLTGIFGKDTSFSGRGAIWQAAIIYIKNNPLWGIGLETDYNVWGNQVHVYSAHNMFLDYAVKYGLLSTVFVIWNVVVVFLNALKRRGDDNCNLLIIIASSLLFASIFEACESFYTTWGVLIWIYFVTRNKETYKGGKVDVKYYNKSRKKTI